MYKITRFSGVDGLLELKFYWEALLKTCKYQAFFNTWRWHYSLAKYLLNSPVNYFLILKDAKPVAIFPLQMVSVEKGGRQWQGYSLPRHKHIDLTDVLICDDVDSHGVLDFFVDFLRNQSGDRWNLLSLTKFRQRSNLYAAISQDASYPVEAYARSFYQPCGMELPSSEAISRKHLKNVSRLQRKAEAEHGKVQLKTVTVESELQEAFERFLSIEASGWKGESGIGSSINSNPGVEAFYRSLINEFGPTGNVAINFLLLGEKYVATQFCIKADGKWSLLKIGYDERYQAFGPGNILLKLLLESLDESAEKCEINLVTGPSWAERWRFFSEPVYCTEIYNKTPTARLLGALLWGRLVWRKHGKRAVASLKGKIK